MRKSLSNTSSRSATSSTLTSPRQSKRYSRRGTKKNLADHVKGRLKKKGEEAFHKLQKMFLGAIEKLDEDAFKQSLIDSQSLIDAGYLDLNQPIKTSTASTFLHTAVWFRKIEIIKFLLAHGAQPNAQNVKGFTPLHYACENAEKPKARDVIAILLRAGGDPYCKTLVTPHVTPIQKIPAQYRSWLDELIEETSKFRQKENELNNQERRDQLVEEWDQERKSRAAERRAPSPIHRDPRLVKKASSAFNQLKKLFGARKNMDLGAIQALLLESHELLEKGYLDLNKDTNATGQRLLHTAVWYQRKDVVQCLLDHGASPNIPNVKGSTPLHISVEAVKKSTDGKEIINLLLLAGGNRDIHNFFDGRIPAEMTTDEEIQNYVNNWQQPKVIEDKETTKIQEMLKQVAEDENRMKAVMSEDVKKQENILKEKLAARKAKKDNKLNNLIKSTLDADDQLRNELMKQRQAQEDAWMRKLSKKSKKGELDNDTENEIKELMEQVKAAELATQDSKSAAEDDFKKRLLKKKKQMTNDDDNENELERLMKDIYATEQAVADSKTAADMDFLNRLKQKRKKVKTDGGIVDDDETEALLRSILEEHDTFDKKRQELQQEQDDDFLSKLAKGKKKKKKEIIHVNTDQLFDLLDSKGDGFITFIKLYEFHKIVHQCNCPLYIIKKVVKTMTNGSNNVLRSNYFDVIRAIQYACIKYHQLYWDFRCVDAHQNYGLLSHDENMTDFFWNCNLDPVSMARFLPNHKAPPTRLKHYVTQRAIDRQVYYPLIDDFIRLEELMDQLIC